jgi:deoxycytidylate deaminase
MQVASGIKLNYFLKAREVGLKNERGIKSRHSCVVVNRHRVVSSAYNQKRTRLENKNVTSCHAEHLALVQAKGLQRKVSTRFRPICY